MAEMDIFLLNQMMKNRNLNLSDLVSIATPNDEQEMRMVDDFAAIPAGSNSTDIEGEIQPDVQKAESSSLGQTRTTINSSDPNEAIPEEIPSFACVVENTSALARNLSSAKKFASRLKIRLVENRL
ncbi:hypothetical protein SNE40_008670 [Patella caerulea]|uniref:Uncharacterized protein n=1 Tax=Patella caerulea TaxID=87958 RepID=A0AAN8JMM6_PATCE